MGQLPGTETNGTANETLLSSFLAHHPSVKYVSFVVHDYGNVARCILTTARRALDIAAHPEDTGAIASVSCQAYASWAVSGTNDDWAAVMAGSDHWVPDWGTLRSACRPDQAVVLCSFRQMTEPEGAQYDRDPRTVLRRVVERAANTGGGEGMRFLVGYEIEFSLLDSIEAATSPAHDTNVDPDGAYNMAATRGPKFELLLQMVDAIEAAGIRVWNFHAELDSAEFEISLGPAEPLAAVDALLHANNIVRSMAKQRGMHASMHPQRVEGGATIGQHVHVSVSEGAAADAFLAGLVKHLRSISAVLMGGYDSYGARNYIVGQGDVSWARSKNCAIRRFGHTRFEVRTPDCVSNPYLQLAAILGTGMDGVEQGMPLEMKESRWLKAEPMDSATKKELGVTDTLPTSQAEAVQAMGANAQVLSRILGDKSFNSYLQFRRIEESKSSVMTRIDRTRAIVRHI